MKKTQYLVQTDYFDEPNKCPHCHDLLQISPNDCYVKYCERGCGHSIRKTSPDTYVGKGYVAGAPKADYYVGYVADGASIWFEDEEAKKPGPGYVGKRIFHSNLFAVEGFQERRPLPGKTLACEFENSWIIYEFDSVTLFSDPYDLFFAKVRPSIQYPKEKCCP